MTAPCCHDDSEVTANTDMKACCLFVCFDLDMQPIRHEEISAMVFAAVQYAGVLLKQSWQMSNSDQRRVRFGATLSLISRLRFTLTLFIIARDSAVVSVGEGLSISQMRHSTASIYEGSKRETI